MSFTDEQLAKVKAAASPEEIMKLAEGEGVAVTEEEARYAFACTHMTEGELADEELENVSGGTSGACYKSGDTAKFSVGERVQMKMISEWRGELVFYDWFPGTITSVSDERSSTFGICKEWRYGVQIDKGDLHADVYEHELRKV